MQKPEYDYDNPVEGALFDNKHGFMLTSDHRIWRAVSKHARLAKGHLWVAVHEPGTGKDVWAEITSEVRITAHELWTPLTGPNFMLADDDELISPESDLNDVIDEDTLNWAIPDDRERLQAMKDDFNDATRPTDSFKYLNDDK